MTSHPSGLDSVAPEVFADAAESDEGLLRAKPRLIVVATVSHVFSTFLAGQPAVLSRDFAVTLVAQPGIELESVGRAENVDTRGIPMTRQITPLRDLRALWSLYKLFRLIRPNIVQSYTPKAGLLAMIAARLARVPVRVHGVIGMPLMEATGWRLEVLRAAELATYASATSLTCNSHRLREWMHESLTRRQVQVLGQGSINGIDTNRFAPPTVDQRVENRNRWGLATENCVYLFAGRMVKEKGLDELVAAFEVLLRTAPQSRLLLVGDFDENGDAVSPETRASIVSNVAIVWTGWLADVLPAYGAADVFVLPSYREGMPNALLEAASVGLPVIATDINGCNEIVEPGHTGLLVRPKDAASLTTAMLALSASDVRAAMGHNARDRIVADFEHATFCDRLVRFYNEVLAVA